MRAKCNFATVCRAQRLRPSEFVYRALDSWSMTDPNGAAIYGNMDPINIPPVMLACIYQHHGSVMGGRFNKKLVANTETGKRKQSKRQDGALNTNKYLWTHI